MSYAHQDTILTMSNKNFLVLLNGLWKDCQTFELSIRFVN